MHLLTARFESLRREFSNFCDNSIPTAQRTVREFAEDEIVCPPGGPRENEPFTIEAQPFAGLLFDSIESGQFHRYAITGPLQSGKTFLLIIVCMWHLFEVGENVIYGIPQMEMAMDKWRRDFLPVIMNSRYRDMLPTTGAGSEGGKFDSITFKNGKTLKFMSAKGGDEKRSGVTSRVLIMTEVDKYDEASETSRESDPVSQMIGRLEAFELTDSVVYMECSVSFDTGRIWVEYNAGTASRIATPCPYCSAHVTLEREHLFGWQDAQNEVEARDNAHFKCPECTHRLDDDDRVEMNKRAVLIHKNQEVTADGKVVGPAPQTFTLGFRWNSSNNLLKSAKDLGWKEWKSRVDPDEDNSERKLLQFTWAKPWNGELNSSGITPEIVAARLNFLVQIWIHPDNKERFYQVPEDTETLVVQVDLHFRWHYYTVYASARNPNPAWKPGAVSLVTGKPIPRWLEPHYSVIDYGVWNNPDRKILGPEGAMTAGLDLLGEDLENRRYITDGGRIVDADGGMIDSKFHQDIALKFATSAGSFWSLSAGKGRKGSDGLDKYIPPKERTAELRPGDHFYYSLQPPNKNANSQQWWLIFYDTPHFMHKVHAGFVAVPWLTNPDGVGFSETRRPGSITLWGDDPHLHLRNVDATIPKSNFGTQICGWTWSEIKSKKKGGGVQVGWNSQYHEDHWLDTTYGAQAATGAVYRYAPRFQPKIVHRPTERGQAFQNPGGENYLITER